MARLKFYNTNTGKWEYADKILNSGNTSTPNAVLFIPQGLNEEQQIQTRKNINACSLSEAEVKVNEALLIAKENGDFDGAQGADGMSAYEYAQLGGYVGTEEEFIAKMSKEYLDLNGNNSMNGSIDMNNNTIINVPIPEQNNQVSNKEYVDTKKQEIIDYVSTPKPYNILSNSNFANPINSKGQQVYINEDGNSHFISIDGWGFYGGGYSDGTLTINDGYISIKVGSDEVASLEQKIDKRLIDDNKIYTLIYKTYEGNFYVKECSFSSDDTYKIFYKSFYEDVNLVWMAVYEGEYTLETLPEFQIDTFGEERAKLYATIGYDNFAKDLIWSDSEAYLTNGMTPEELSFVVPEYDEIEIYFISDTNVNKNLINSTRIPIGQNGVLSNYIFSSAGVPQYTGVRQVNTRIEENIVYLDFKAGYQVQTYSAFSPPSTSNTVMIPIKIYGIKY